MYCYRAYELVVHSELKLIDYRAHESDDADVVVRFGDVPKTLPGNPVYHSTWQAIPGTLIFDMLGVGRFMVKNGNEITIERYPGTGDKSLAVQTESPMMAAILQQRGHLTLHGSSINGPKGAVCFVGPSGAGKSTLLSSMVKLGYPMLSDDITPLKFQDDGRIDALPGTQRTRLWGDSIEALKRERSEGHQIREQIKKFSLPIDIAHNAPIPISKIYVISTPNSGTPATSKLQKMDAFRLLRNNTYRKYYYHGLGLADQHFSMVNRLVDHVEVRKIIRPPGKYFNGELAELVDQEIAG